MTTKEERIEELKQQFETTYTEVVGNSNCFTQYSDNNYVNGVVQVAWKMYLYGHSAAYAHVKDMQQAVEDTKQAIEDSLDY